MYEGVKSRDAIEKIVDPVMPLRILLTGLNNQTNTSIKRTLGDTRMLNKTRTLRSTGWTVNN